MTFEWKTKKININNYYKAMQRCIILNGDNGKHLSGYKAWQKFKKTWKVIVVPVDKAEEYKRFYKHLKIEGSGGMAWGITGKNVLYWFVTDSRNPMIFRQNIGPGFHECLHALYQQEVGTMHVKRLYNSPDGKVGTRGPAATVIVHDNWYGSKYKITSWIRHGSWLPMRMPYIPIKTANRLYGL